MHHGLTDPLVVTLVELDYPELISYSSRGLFVLLYSCRGFIRKGARVLGYNIIVVPQRY
jgi:hypothetical protein